jgi:NAD-dependent SIR2 family protein deacetylase
LLDALVATPAERQQLLRGYFEPTEEGAEQGIKTPTVAHQAIAELVSEGYVRVVLTTNFDRLTERAIE